MLNVQLKSLYPALDNYLNHQYSSYNAILIVIINKTFIQIDFVVLGI